MNLKEFLLQKQKENSVLIRALKKDLYKKFLQLEGDSNSEKSYLFLGNKKKHKDSLLRVDKKLFQSQQRLKIFLNQKDF